ncbi:RPAP1-like protein [Syncephalis fuscata]|nr:RPAP1-like protein [Syncephalis fuscata]
MSQLPTESSAATRTKQQQQQPSRVQVRFKDTVQTEEDLLALHEAFIREQVKPAAQVKRIPKATPIKVPSPIVHIDDDNETYEEEEEEMPPLVPAATKPQQTAPAIKESNAASAKARIIVFAQRQAALLERVRSLADDHGLSTSTVSTTRTDKGVVLADITERTPNAADQQQPPKVIPLSTITGFPEPDLLPKSINHSLNPSTNPVYAEIDRENRSQIEAMTEEEIEQAPTIPQHNINIKEEQLSSNSGIVKESDDDVEIVGEIESMASTAPSDNQTDIPIKNRQNQDDEDPITLRQRYFSDVPLEADKLAWMGIINKDGLLCNTDDTTLDTSKESGENTESSSTTTTRYDLRGQPILSNSEVPVHHGLHHHGKEQDKAGYTIEELLLLARSAVAAQRATAWRILSRILWLAHDGSTRTLQDENEASQWSKEQATGAITQFAELSGPMYLTLGLEESHLSTIAHVVDALDAWCSGATDHQYPTVETDPTLTQSTAPQQIRSNLDYAGRLRVLATLDVVPRLQYAQRQGRPTEKTLEQIDRLITQIKWPTITNTTKNTDLSV